jgi:hypothetical protein
MKNISAALYFLLLHATWMPFAQASASAQAVEAFLSQHNIRSELQNVRRQLNTLIGDNRLTDVRTRQMLILSESVIAEMLDQRTGTNTYKLLTLAKWQRDQSIAKNAIYAAGGEPDVSLQLILQNPMAGQEVPLTSIIYRILSEYVRNDGVRAGDPTLESYLQLYLEFRDIVEGGTGIPECLLLKAPDWMQSRFPQLTDDQKRLLLRECNEARAERSRPPLPDEVPAAPPTPQEEAAYEAAYQFIVDNTPQP